MKRARKKPRSAKTRLITLTLALIAISAVTVYLLTQPPGSQPTSPPLGASSAPGEEYAWITTKFGTIVIRFFPQEAPRHVENFKKLASQGFYNDTTFHRVIPGFMIQGGDPNSKDDDRSNDGTGGPGYTVNAEFNSRSHTRSIVSMARSRDPNSAGSQFFIVVKDSPHLDGQYTVFGEVIRGMDTVDQIVVQTRDSNDNPLSPIKMQVSLRSAP